MSRMNNWDDPELCAVKDCDEEPHAHFCPFDSKSHWHGRIHYDLDKSHEYRDGWHLICDTHYDNIVANVESHV